MLRPFFCQVEAAETAIWLAEVAPKGKSFWAHIENVNEETNPELVRTALKLATGAGKTTVMAMLIVWQTVNAVRHPQSKRFTRGFLMVTPGITIRDGAAFQGNRLRVLQPNDPDSYYAERELVPADMLPDLQKAKIVITNYHAFKLRERMQIAAGTRKLVQGRGPALNTLETEGQMLQRVMPELMGMKNVLVINDVPGGEMPKFRNLWEHIGKKMPKKGRGKAKALDPLSLPPELQTALNALYGHYEKTYELWKAQEIGVPPVFIVVCNNTSTSKLVYDYISGFVQTDDDGKETPYEGRLALFRNTDTFGNALALPNTLLIDSEQLESGEALDSKFREMASDEIEKFRRDVVQRSGDQSAGQSISDQDLLREVMNTVGKAGKLGASIRWVVSVSMLTEGWDANTVTHVLGVRAFGTQLLCEQVIGRALRRQSYELNEDGKFNVEYADVLGIPFDFTAKPVVVKPVPPRKTVNVKAVRPERDALEIQFPRVAGYRVELPDTRLTAKFGEDSLLELTPSLVGPSVTRNEGIVGEGIDLDVKHMDTRDSTILFHLTKHLLYNQYRNPGEEPKVNLFGQLKRITKQWMDDYLDCKGETYKAQVLYQEIANMACERIRKAITEASVGEKPIKAVLDAYNPVSSTAHVSFNTSKTDL